MELKANLSTLVMRDLGGGMKQMPSELILVLDSLQRGVDLIDVELELAVEHLREAEQHGHGLALHHGSEHVHVDVVEDTRVGVVVGDDLPYLLGLSTCADISVAVSLLQVVEDELHARLPQVVQLARHHLRRERGMQERDRSEMAARTRGLSGRWR